MTGLRKELSFAGENPKGNKEIKKQRNNHKNSFEKVGQDKDRISLSSALFSPVFGHYLSASWSLFLPGIHPSIVFQTHF
jgi:hypothetical protein